MNNPLRKHMPAPLRSVAEAPARLHLGFLDPSATLGRRFASLGLVIDGFATRLELLPAAANQVELRTAESEALATRLAQQLAGLQRATGALEPLRVILHQAPPSHAGLGSGTQLALALGHAFASAHGLDLDTPTIAALLGRGERSGVGIAGFQSGGLLLDGGPGADGRVAPVLARVDFPDEWRVILILDDALDGLHGAAEREAIEAMPPFPCELAAELCHLTLMCVLPAAIERNFAPFARGISAIQQHIGEYYAPAQGGSMFTSARVGKAIGWIGAHHCAAVGQSSWGPTGFAIVASAAEADRALRGARLEGALDHDLQVRVVTGRNVGGRVHGGAESLGVA